MRLYRLAPVPTELTPTTRAYASSLTDAEWAVLQPLVPRPATPLGSGLRPAGASRGHARQRLHAMARAAWAEPSNRPKATWRYCAGRSGRCQPLARDSVDNPVWIPQESAWLAGRRGLGTGAASLALQPEHLARGLDPDPGRRAGCGASGGQTGNSSAPRVRACASRRVEQGRHEP